MPSSEISRCCINRLWTKHHPGEDLMWPPMGQMETYLRCAMVWFGSVVMMTMTRFYGYQVFQKFEEFRICLLGSCQHYYTTAFGLFWWCAYLGLPADQIYNRHMTYDMPTKITMPANMCSPLPLRSGFLHAIQLVLKLREGALVTAGPPCGSFVFLNMGTSKRSKCRPLGGRLPYVKKANLPLSEKQIVL